MSETIQNGKFVELTYKVSDKKSGHVLTRVEFPLSYVHGYNEILAPSVHKELEGKSAGDVIEVLIDGNQIFGSRDESLVFTDHIALIPSLILNSAITTCFSWSSLKPVTSPIWIPNISTGFPALNPDTELKRA